MRPPWPRLALRSLVGGGPVGPGCGLGWPRQEWPGVARLLIQLHSVAFRCIPYRRRGAGGHPHPSLLPSRDLCVTAPGGRSSSHPPARYARGDTPTPPAVGIAPLHSPIRGATRAAPYELCKVSSREKGPARLRGNDGEVRSNDVCEQCSNRRGYGAMGSCQPSLG